MDKKINLEHTIRVVVNESLGMGITTDKYVRTGNSFFKSVHIEPKKGDSHVPINGSVRSSRNVQKERSSETMKEEENIDENVVKLLVKGGELLAKSLRYADDAEAAKKMTKDFWSKIKPAEELPVITKPAEKLPAPQLKAPETPAAAKPPAKISEPTVSKPPEVKTQTKPETATLPKIPDAVKAPETVTLPKTQTQTLPKIELPTQTQTQTQTLPKTQTQNLPKTRTQTQEKTRPPGRGGGGGGRGGGKGGRNRFFGLPSASPGSSPLTGLKGYVPVDPYLHYAKDRMTFGEEIDIKDAEEIKAKSRKAQIIRKIIDEQKKKKETSTVILNPKLKDQEVDKN